MLPQPSLESLASVCHNCSKQRKVATALRLQSYTAQRGLQTHTSVGNNLVCLLVHAGLLCIAHNLFNRIVLRSELSWNSLIHGFFDHGHPTLALSIYQRMQEASICPNAHTFVALLQACAKLKDFQTGCEIHANIAEKGLLKQDLFLGSALIDMYGKCKSLELAQELFDSLPCRNTITWNALIAGYVQHDCGAEALHYFEQMQLHGVSPDAVTFTCILKACASTGAIDKGNEIHADIADKGLLTTNPFVSCALVDMYAKFGMLAKAQEIFDMLPTRNVVVWTALISGYVQQECGDAALSYFEQMQIQGVAPNAVTYVCSLKACGISGLLDKGIKIHADIARRKMIIEDLSIGNALLDMYARLNLLSKAREVFDQLPLRNVVTWNTLLTGHVQHEHGEEALEIFEEMQLQGVSPDAISVSCVLRACGSIGNINKGSALHTKLLETGLLDTDISLGDALVDMYAKCGALVKAQQVFDNLPTVNVVTWNSLMMGFTRHGHGEDALKCFEQMRFHNVLPDATTFACILRACGNIGATEKGRIIHDEISEVGLLDTDVFIGSALVDMYTKLGLLCKAHEVFDGLPVRDVVTWTALIAGYAQHEGGEEALKCLKVMKSEGIIPNAHTFACSLKACGSSGALDKGREIHSEINRNMSLNVDFVIGSALVDMYAKCGSLVTAQDIFDVLPNRNRVTWTALITGYAQLGEIDNVLCLFDQMVTEGFSPDPTTFLNVLTACSHAGLVDKGHACFESMSKDYDITPTLIHYTSMVDLLGRAGQLERAFAVMRGTPLNSDVVMSLAVLGSCRKWGDVEIGRWAFEQAVDLDEMGASAYVCMFNIYADADIQEEASG